METILSFAQDYYLLLIIISVMLILAIIGYLAEHKIPKEDFVIAKTTEPVNKVNIIEDTTKENNQAPQGGSVPQLVNPILRKPNAQNSVMTQNNVTPQISQPEIITPINDNQKEDESKNEKPIKLELLKKEKKHKKNVEEINMGVSLETMTEKDNNLNIL